MRRVWPVAVAVLGFAALGLANVLKAPAGGSAEARQAQAKLDSLPLALGPWKGTAHEVPERQLRISRAQAHLSRTYVHERTGAAVAVMALFGDPGQLGAHTPEVCYEGAGFKPASAESVRTVPGEPAEFWTARFETGGFPPTTVQVTWGWGAGGEWKASAAPRLDFAGRGQIYKLYVSRTLPPGVGPTDKDPTDEFLSLFLKEFRDGSHR